MDLVTTVEVRGDVIAALFDALADDVDHVTRDLADDIRTNTPVDVGTASGAVYHRTDGYTGEIGYRRRGFYWRFRNDGTRHQAGLHFVDTAVERHRDDLGDRTRSLLARFSE